jgi:hypothetical protein
MTGDPNMPADFLAPYLLMLKVPDINNPTVAEATRADADCRSAYKARLKARFTTLGLRLETENSRLTRRNQTFSRTREHAEGAAAEHVAAVTASTLRITVLGQRMAALNAAMPLRIAELDSRLRADLRLQPLYDPIAYRARLKEAGLE